MNKNQQTNKQKQLEFSVKNMGSVRKGSFTQKPLTLFCGPNNSGKTWVMYALCAFYDLAGVYRNRSARLRQLSFAFLPRGEQEEEKQSIKKEISLSSFNKGLHDRLAHYFNASAELFKETEFQCTFAKEDWEKWIEDYANHPYVFLMPAERSGLHLFYRELSTRRTALLHHASKENINLNELLHDVMHSRYAKPIADYIDWLNSLTTQQKGSDDFHKEALFLQKELVQGRYHLNRQTGDITYKPYQKKRNNPVNNLGLHTASSTVKSLFGLWFYLEHQAKTGDILMIDEPELNIHPSNQLLIARLLARLVNAGIQVVISTHSDYIVREFNNLILLSEDAEGTLKKQKQYKYQPQEILKPEQVGAYLFDENTIKPFTYKRGQGFAISTFDEVIKDQNEVSNEIYYGLQDQGVDQ